MSGGAAECTRALALRLHCLPPCTFAFASSAVDAPSAPRPRAPCARRYSEPHAFTLDWDDALGHLSLITAVDEWRALKAIHGLTTPVEDNLLLHGRQLWLQAQELVYIPIKFQVR